MFSLKSNIKEKLNDLKRVDKKNLFRKFINIICGDSKDIAGKYYKLRGTMTDKEDVDRIITENKKKYLLLVVLFLILTLLCIVEFNKCTEGIIKNKYGEIVSLTEYVPYKVPYTVHIAIIAGDANRFQLPA